MNQLTRKHRKALDDLLDLGERLRKAQRAMMSGRGGGTAVKELSAERRKAVNALAVKAVKLLGASGEAQRDAITATLDAAVVDEEAADVVGAGRLTKELPAPSGFGDVPGLSVVPDVADGAAPETAAEKKRRDERRAARAAKRGGGRATPAAPADASGGDDTDARERKALEAVVAEKRATLEKAAEEAQAAAREAAAARAEVSRLQDALVSANGHAKAATEKARVAQWAQSQAQQEVDAAERKLYAT